MADQKQQSAGSAERVDELTDNQQKTGADFDETVREAEADTKTAKPGQSQGGNSQQHNNGRGGGK